MKYTKLVYILFAVLMVFSACESDDEIDTPSYAGSTWLQFQNEAISTNEATPINIPVLLASAENTSGVTVNFTVTSDTPDRFNITQNGSVTIPAGEFSANIELIPVDDSMVNGDALVTLTISNTDISAGLGGQGVRFNSINITVIDNDCIPMPVANYTASVRAFNDDAPSYTAMLTPVAGTTNQYAIDSAWGPNFVGWATGDPSFDGAFIYPAIIEINTDLTINVIGTVGYGTGGTGTYDSCGDVFNYTLTQALFTTDFTVDVTLTAN